MDQEFYKSSPEMITAHYGEEYERYYNAIVPPIYMNSLNIFPNIDAYFDADKFDKHTYIYGRVQNPTVRILEDKLAALEHGCASYVFSSGMAAATTAVQATVKAGGNIVCIRNAYGPLANYVSEHCPAAMGTTITWVEGNSVEEFKEAITENTQLVILESPASVTFFLQDIAAVAELAHAVGAKVYIDNTFCTPVYQNPLDLGADIVMHTISKYLGGHSDVIGGVLVVKDPDFAKVVADKRELLGGIIGPMEAWLTLRGVRTLSVRVPAHGAAALKVAQYLENHPKVRKVNYPGLESFPQHELYKKQMRGCTGLLSFEIEGTKEQAKQIVNSLKVFKIGVSWGGFESLACMPMLRLSDEKAQWMGGDQNTIRLHIGLEGVDALIADLDDALANI
ncbi:MAG: aminotransferase class I/II-fold pyridoxal phosphate-dependent enzyme [Oscillospiraceae bacterium]|nr:aminotransferase class I/II-fold pyridoxal phosphate-dependent enzyme [Oscillospiraceae bacterium]